jgi:uncharacterized membrane protein YkoI
MAKGKNNERLRGAVIGVILTFILMSTIPAFARMAQETITVNFNNIRIVIDGQQVHTEFEPFIFQGRTYLPVHDVANAMGFDVTWEDTTNTVHLTTRTNFDVAPDYPPHQTTPTPQGTISRGNAQINPAPMPTVSPQATASSSRRGSRPSNPTISLERAIEIAEADLARRGINATFHSHSGIDWERGQWVWELEFRVRRANRGRHVIEYYINVDTGAIVKFEWDS